MTSRSARAVRGLLTAAFSVFVAAFSHVAAGGDTPGVVGVTVALAFATMLSVALAGTTLSLGRLTASVILSQLLLHLLFGVGAAGSAFTVTGAAHHGGSMSIQPTASVLPQAGMHDEGWMWVAHACAALVTIIALRYGEKAFWGLLRQAGNRLAAVVFACASVSPVPVARSVVRAAAAGTLLRTDLGVVLSTMRRRGPPPALFSA
jgi:hypothetical protein